MRANFQACLDITLGFEGGFVDDPRDPGGATKYGVTIGTLRRLGIDVDGDGDSDLADLKSLRPQDLVRVYRPSFWDAVGGDDLPAGLDLVAFDAGVMSGPARSLKWLVRGGDVRAAIEQTCANRLAFLMAVRHPKTGAALWPTYGRGWGRRVAEVQRLALGMVR